MPYFGKKEQRKRSTGLHCPMLQLKSSYHLYQEFNSTWFNPTLNFFQPNIPAPISAIVPNVKAAPMPIIDAEQFCITNTPSLLGRICT
ncbi:hypothetical protein [Butyrivibrio sp. LB2008]|uniref:hypothetical protein n=1 Tax=Butyrivibrio sp. LB2008 TaxID=1408305 RepID=UPI0012DE6B30|nr:hypothetical protein [Butyrivibrio sp. LB2008]